MVFRIILAQGQPSLQSLPQFYLHCPCSLGRLSAGVQKYKESANYDYIFLFRVSLNFKIFLSSNYTESMSFVGYIFFPLIFSPFGGNVGQSVFKPLPLPGLLGNIRIHDFLCSLSSCVLPYVRILLQLQVRGNPIPRQGIMLPLRILKNIKEPHSHQEKIWIAYNLSYFQYYQLFYFLQPLLLCILAFILMHKALWLQYDCCGLKYKVDEKKMVPLQQPLYLLSGEKKKKFFFKWPPLTSYWTEVCHVASSVCNRGYKAREQLAFFRFCVRNWQGKSELRMNVCWVTQHRLTAAFIFFYIPHSTQRIQVP